MELTAGQTTRLGPLQSGFLLEIQSSSPGLRGAILGLGRHFDLLSPVFGCPFGGESRDGAVAVRPASGGYVLEIQPAKLPADLSRLFILCQLDPQQQKLLLRTPQHAFNALTSSPVGQGLLVAQLYRQDGEWYLHGIGKGYSGPLESLIQSFDPARAAEARTAGVGETSTAQQSVRLLRNESVNLSRLSTTPLRQVSFALGWEPMESGEEVDLDASCLAFTAEKKVLDKVWFWHLKGCKGTVRHSGDNLTGEGSGDLETITVDLMALPEQIRWLVFTVNSFRGHRLSRVRKAYCKVTNLEEARELAHYELNDAGDVTGVVMAKLERIADGWNFTALGLPAGGLTVHSLVRPAREVL